MICNALWPRWTLDRHNVHCMYCHALFLVRDLWRHVRNCLSKPVEDRTEQGRTRVLSLATMSNTALRQQISQGEFGNC